MIDVVLTSRWIGERYALPIADAAPAARLMTIEAGQRLTADDVAAITIAYFSGDVWRSGSTSLMRVALDAPNLQWLHVFNAGTDHPVFELFRERGVRLTTSSGSSAVPIAHTVMMQVLNLVRDSPRWWREQQRREWHQRDVADVEGRTLGIVGLGAIGGEVARLASAFGIRVLAIRRTPTGTEPYETWPVSRLDDMLPLVDDLVLTAPLTSDTHRLIDGRRLAMLRPGAHLVNVGRGELVDEDAMVDALRSGQLGGAALDVFTTEPLPDDSALWSMPNVLISPHSAGSTERSHRRANELFVVNLGRYVRNEPLLNDVSSTRRGN
jgi:phosphoglycerate dehydrogenase-like enzyme